MSAPDIKNAVITSARFDVERGLSAWLMLDYGGSGQGFGGYLLYGPAGWAAHNQGGNFAGHFIWRVLEIAGVEDWADLVGKPIRARVEDGTIYAIGHIIHDKWFCPREEFKEMQAKFNPQPEEATL